MDKNFIMMCKTATEHLIEHKSISEKQSISMFGINGSAVYEKLKEIGVGKNIGYGDLQVTSEAKRLINSQYFETLIEKIENEEHDRMLSNKSKEATIKSARIAKIALVLSILSLTGLPQMFFKWIFSLIFNPVD
jgi:hypothetical protein